MSMLGNTTFTGVQNLVGQVPQLDVAELLVFNATVQNHIIHGSLDVTGDLIVGGQIFAAAGTVAAPSYSFFNNDTTGMWLPANNIIGFSAAASLEARISITNHLSVHIGDPTAPSFNFLGDENTGMYNHGGDIIGFSSGGTTEATISTLNHLSVNTGGGAVTPSFNFISDDNTGMYRVQADTIGLSVGGEQKVTVASSGVLPIGMIDGLNVGTTGAVVGIQRLSAIAANSWQDGHMGNSSSLVFTPADFVSAGPDSGVAVTLEWANVGSTVPDPRTAGRFYSARSANNKLIAQKIIPKGFKITGGTDTLEIFTPTISIVGCTCYVTAQSLDIGGGTNILNLTRQITNYDTNNPVTLNGTGNIATGDGLQIVTIYFDANVPLTHINGVGGAQITMTRA